MVTPQAVQQMVDTALDMFAQAVVVRNQAAQEMTYAVQHERAAHAFRVAAEAERDAAVKWKRAGRWALWVNIASAVFCLAIGIWNAVDMFW